MSIIDQLEQTVTPAVLGDKGSVAHVSLLEQFYAILAARLALPQVYSQLLRADQVIAADNIIETPLFEQLWQTANLRQTMIQELAATHHIDELATSHLLINAAPLAYRELKVLANGKFLPAFLQAEQPSLRQYLPIWSAPIISASQNPDHELFRSPSTIANADIAAAPPVSLNKDEAFDVATIAASTSLPTEPASENFRDPLNFSDPLHSDAIHASPAAHHLAENSSMKQEKVRTRNQRNDLLLRVFLLVAAFAAIGLVWALLIRPNSELPVEPMVTAPVVVPPTSAPAAQVLTPVELIVGVDDSGSLYTCSASIGDVSLQGSLQQALNTSFGEQASICQLTVQEGVATSLANMPIEALPNLFTLLRSTPFARLHLQNDRMTLEAPDSMLLQRLVTDIRTLVPAMVIDSTAPLPLANNNGSGMAADDMAALNGLNNQFENEGTSDYQAADDNAGDSVTPAPARNDSRNSSSNSNGSVNNAPINNVPAPPSGPISLAEVDDMASSVIVAEPAQVR